MKVWRSGAKVHVCFNGGSSLARKRIADAAAIWTSFGNLTFDFGSEPGYRSCPTGNVEGIKIAFANTGYWSYVGTDSNQFSPSMNLQGFDSDNLSVSDQEFRRIVLHEFGHAIGLEHEHQSPEARCSDEMDWAAAETYYKNCCGWEPKTVRSNLETLMSSRSVRVSRYDRLSIMHYSLPAAIFKTGRKSRCFVPPNYELSAQDKTAAEDMYPESQQAQDTRQQKLVSQFDEVLSKAKLGDEERSKLVDKITGTYGGTNDVNIKGNTSNAGRDVNQGVVTTTIQDNIQKSNGGGPNVISGRDTAVK
jgi:hypothetical protein